MNFVYLLLIVNKEENDKIFDLVKKFLGLFGKINIWLGMERLFFDLEFYWIDKILIIFNNWVFGEFDKNGVCV